jgi:hypothetical protein
MDHSITNTKIPDIIYDYKDHIIKCVETNSPIKRTIRKEIYKWAINEIHEYKNQERCAFICLIIKNMYFTIFSMEHFESVCNFNLNNEKQNVFPELNVNKIKRYAIKHKIKIDTTTTNAAWFDGYDYYIRIDVLTHCIDTIDKNIKREKRVASLRGNNIKTNNIK